MTLRTAASSLAMTIVQIWTLAIPKYTGYCFIYSRVCCQVQNHQLPENKVGNSDYDATERQYDSAAASSRGEDLTVDAPQGRHLSGRVCS